MWIMTPATRTVTTPVPPLPCGVHAMRDLQWLGQVRGRLDHGVAGGPRKPACLLGVLADSPDAERDIKPENTTRPVRSITDILAARESDRQRAATVEAALDRVRHRREVWARVLEGVYVQRRDADDVLAVLLEVGKATATVEQLVGWTQRTKTRTWLDEGAVRDWTRGELEDAVTAYDKEAGG